MDVLAVRECMKFVKQYALHHGPIIMECDTYRYFGRSPVDDSRYVYIEGSAQGYSNSILEIVQEMEKTFF